MDVFFFREISKRLPDFVFVILGFLFRQIHMSLSMDVSGSVAYKAVQYKL